MLPPHEELANGERALRYALDEVSECIDCLHRAAPHASDEELLYAAQDVRVQLELLLDRYQRKEVKQQ